MLSGRKNIYNKSKILFTGKVDAEARGPRVDVRGWSRVQRAPARPFGGKRSEDWASLTDHQPGWLSLLPEHFRTKSRSASTTCTVLPLLYGARAGLIRGPPFLLPFFLQSFSFSALPLFPVLVGVCSTARVLLYSKERGEGRGLEGLEKAHGNTIKPYR